MRGEISKVVQTGMVSTEEKGPIASEGWSVAETSVGAVTGFAAHGVPAVGVRMRWTASSLPEPERY